MVKLTRIGLFETFGLPTLYTTSMNFVSFSSESVSPEPMMSIGYLYHLLIWLQITSFLKYYKESLHLAINNQFPKVV